MITQNQHFLNDDIVVFDERYIIKYDFYILAI